MISFKEVKMLFILGDYLSGILSGVATSMAVRAVVPPRGWIWWLR